METPEKAWFSYLQVFFRWRKFYIITLFGVFVVACIVSLILPKIYKSTTTILPPLSTTGFEALIPDEIKGFFGGFMGQNAEANVYLAILNSRNMQDKLIEKFNLDSVYKFKEPYYIEELLEVLKKHINISFDGENPMEISFLDKNPKRAAEVVNYMVNELDVMYQAMNNKQASLNRQFLEKRVTEARETLAKSEDSLRIFQEKYKAISLTDQASAAIDVAANLVAEMMTLEVQIQVLQSSVQPNHPQLKALKEELQGLKDQLSRITDSMSDDSEVIIPFPGMDVFPELGMRYLRLFREVEIQTKILEFLIPQYEQARIQEVRDTPVVTVLDKGRVPTKRIKPQRKILVIIAVFLSFIVCTFFVFIAEFFLNVKNTDYKTYSGLEEILSQIKQEIPFIRKRKPL
jgi:uncharacterized protein involved in exopolysaccharide biosynthesis